MKFFSIILISIMGFSSAIAQVPTEQRDEIQEKRTESIKVRITEKVPCTKKGSRLSGEVGEFSADGKLIAYSSFTQDCAGKIKLSEIVIHDQAALEKKGSTKAAYQRSRNNDFSDCVRDYCLTGKVSDGFVHQYLQNEAAADKL